MEGEELLLYEGEDNGDDECRAVFLGGDTGGVLVSLEGDDDVVVVDTVFSGSCLSRGACCKKDDAKSPTRAVNSNMRCRGVLNSFRCRALARVANWPNVNIFSLWNANFGVAVETSVVDC